MRNIYRDDIRPETTWVVSDTHFGHENIKAFCCRPDSVEQTIMEEWASTVPAEDSTLLHLGDLCYRGNAWFKNMIAPHLTGGRKFLIPGNHDKQRYSFYRDCGFKLAKPFSILYRGYDVSFSHYPWNLRDEGRQPANSLRLHGHIHNNGYTRDAYVPFLKRHINLSCEQTKYRPVNLQHLLDGALFAEAPGWEDPVGQIKADIVEPKPR